MMMMRLLPHAKMMRFEVYLQYRDISKDLEATMT
jgi:hypothetical protein